VLKPTPKLQRPACKLNMGEQFRLMIQLAAGHGAVDSIEVCFKFQMLHIRCAKVARLDVAR
jgi:hypothetical protein